MSLSEILYRAFADYRKITKDERECLRRREAMSRAGKDADKLEIVETKCKIDDDWIVAIEEGLPFIGKAIAEERQFIRSNGEVVDIEKVKTVSKESSEHLARHSDLLTRRPVNGNIVPDRLYTVERLTDYAVYENRFLYMLLCYLRDFVSYRYMKIADAVDTYIGELGFDKVIEKGERKTVFKISLHDERKDEDFLREKSGCKGQLERIDGIMRTVEMYLATPLMEFVAKAPVLKPPVTETNVLKMNKNFKEAMKLYHFLVSYEKEGFSVTREALSLVPFSESVADEFAEAAELFVFLAYEYGSGQADNFRARYEEYLKEQAREDEERERQKLISLQKRVAETGQGEKEYMLALEERLRELESQSLEIPEMRAKIEQVVSDNERLESLRKDAVKMLEESERVLTETQLRHKAEKDNLCAEYESRLLANAKDAQEERARLAQAHAEELSEKQAEFSEKLRVVEEESARKISEAEELARSEREESERKLQEAIRKTAEMERAAESSREDARRWEQEKILADARLNALKKEYGELSGEDFTSRENFNEIERQYNIFRSFFKEEWKKTKKRIKREVLRGGKEEKVNSDSHKDEKEKDE